MSIGDLLREMFADCTGEQGFVAGCLFSLGFVFEWVLLSKMFDLVCNALKRFVRMLLNWLRKFIRSRKTDTAE